MTRRGTRAELATAHHEAGHAVACIDQRVRLLATTIEPSEDYLGCCAHGNPLKNAQIDVDTSRLNRLRMERLVRVSLAGPAAQRRFSPRSYRHKHGEDDFHQAVGLLSYFSGGDEHLETYLKLLKIEAEGLVRKNWHCIEAIAHRLIKMRTLRQNDIRKLYYGSWEKIVKARMGRTNG